MYLLKVALLILPLVAGIKTNIRDNEVYAEHPNVKFPYPDQPEIFEVDGVEYVDRSGRNITLRAVLKEELFTNVQDNFVNGF